MAIFSIEEAQARAASVQRQAILESRNPNFTFEGMITENNRSLDNAKALGKISSFDIFLSHSFQDARTIAGIMLELIQMGYIVYVDWVIDANLDRTQVTKSTAEKLVSRLKSSKSLFYAASSNSDQSKWMPWELGFKHGHNDRCAILPLKKNKHESDVFIGTEYLGLYDLVVKEAAQLWICPYSYAQSPQTVCKHFDAWAAVTPKPIHELRSLGMK